MEKEEITILDEIMYEKLRTYLMQFLNLDNFNYNLEVFYF